VGGAALAATVIVIVALTVLASTRMRAAPSMAVAIRAGLLILLVAQAVGGWMIGHGVGQASDGVTQGLTTVGAAGVMKVLSGGQQKRLDVALALIGDPELVFLDEPTTGFDPAARQSAWEVIAGLRDLGKTIFLTTHYMEEAERLADQIAVIAAGRMAAWAKARNIDLPDIQVIRPTLEDTYLRLIRVTR